MDYEENKVELTGFAGSNPELKDFGGNKKLAKVSIAVRDQYKGAGKSEARDTLWFNLVFWNAMAEEAISLVKKGTRFTVRGKLLTQQYEAKDGSKRSSTEISVQEIHVHSIAAKTESEESNP